MFNNLRELVTSMPDEKDCREYLANQRWPDGKVLCPYCGGGHIYRIKERQRYKCGNPECYKKFSVTVGTIFEASKIPLKKWFIAAYLAFNHKKGISSYQLGRDIGVSQKCAWFMLHRIRELMRDKAPVKLDNIVEMDEVYIGGKVGNMSKTKRTQLREQGLTLKTKTMVMGLIERGGELRFVTLDKDNSANILKPVVRDNVDTDAVLITDGLESYKGLRDEYAAHEVVRHDRQEYVRDKVFHTNSIEGAFSLLKRSIIGIYHQVSPGHLSRYCDETMYRYNTRKIKDCARFTYSLQRANGRLKYKDLVLKDKVKLVPAAPVTTKFKRKPIIQFKNGEFVAQYPTIADAAKLTGLKQSSIWRVLHGKKNTTGGFEWKYL